MERTVVRALASVAAVALIASGAHGETTYVRPVAVDGMFFPVARTNWYSLINFTDDWHVPRFRKEGGRWRLSGLHEGTDIFAEPRTPIHAVTGGTVERIGWLFYAGWRVGVRDDQGRYWFYAHLERYAPGLAVGQRVEAGALLGEMGNTGYSERPGHRGDFPAHLHLGLQMGDGTWVNPYPLLNRIYSKTTRD